MRDWPLFAAALLVVQGTSGQSGLLPAGIRRLSNGADIIGITSFNEWPETTIVEPPLTWGDPPLLPSHHCRAAGEEVHRPAASTAGTARPGGA